MTETRACAECGASLPSGVTDVFCPACELRGGEQQFDRRWATTVLVQARTKLREECVASGKAGLYDRVSLVEGQVEGGVPHAVIAQELGMTISAVKSAVSRLRRRYGELVRQEVAHTISSPAEIQPELRHLLSVIGA